MMLPLPWAAMIRAAVCMARKVPFRLSVTTRSNSSEVMSSRGLRTLIDGVHTSTSRVLSADMSVST